MTGLPEIEIIPTKGLTHQQWLDKRKKGIGGSDTGTMFDLNKYKSRMQLWKDKTGQSDPDDNEMSEAAYWGTVQEDTVAREFSRRTELKVQKCNFMIKRGCQIANVDRLVCDGNKNPFVKGEFRGKAILECKTASEYVKDQWGEPWTDQIPETYILQVQQYMDILGAEVCYVAVLIGGNDFRIYLVKYDPEIAKFIREESENFWNDYVLSGQSPAPRSAAEVQELFSKTHRETVVASEDIEDVVIQLKQIKQQMKELKENEDILKDQICVYLSDKEDLINPQGDTLATWRSAKPSRKTAWQKVAQELEAPSEIIEKYTSESVSRRFLVK